MDKIEIKPNIMKHRSKHSDNEEDFSDWEDFCGKIDENDRKSINHSDITLNIKKCETNEDKFLTETSELDNYEIISDENSSEKFENIPLPYKDKHGLKNGKTKAPYSSSALINGILEFMIKLVLYTVAAIEILAMVLCKVLIKIKEAFERFVTSELSNRKKEKRNKNPSINQNTNNNALCEEDSDIQSLTILCIYMFISVGGIAFFLSYCWIHPESQMCSIQYIYKQVKEKLIEIWEDFYMLPGDDCMHANRCCKGFLEAFFRWVTCLVTIQIRAALTAIPHSQDTDVQPESIDNIRVLVDKILSELSDIKERVNKMEELLMKLRQQYAQLEKLIREKSNDVILVEPLIKKYSKKLKILQELLQGHRSHINNVISIKDDVEKIVDNMKKAARDASTQIKTSITMLKAFTETEAHRLETQLDVLETMIKEDEQRIKEANDGHIVKARSEMEHIRIMQEDIRQRLQGLSDLPDRYKVIAQRMKDEVRNKLQQDLIFHEDLTKKTECFCMTHLEDFKKSLEDMKVLLSCFLEKKIVEKMSQVDTDIKNDLTKNFYEHTVEIAKEIAEEAMLNNVKVNTINDAASVDKPAPKGAGLMMDNELFNSANKEKQSEITEQNHCDKNALEDLKQCSKSLFNATNYAVILQNMKNKQTTRNLCLTQQQISDLIKQAFLLYSTGDKIGLPDFALESMGAAVLPQYSSATYNIKLKTSTDTRKQQTSFLSYFFNFVSDANKNDALYHATSLRNVINPSTKPGDCWSFAGSRGHVVVKLSRFITIKAISIDHISASLNPLGDISSAPFQISVSTFPAIKGEKTVELGTFEYKDSPDTIQTFWIKNPVAAHSVKLTILSNHGNEEFTCLYRFRVHGSLVNQTKEQ